MTFVHDHPWMTFFIAGGALYTVRVIARGWEPDPFATKPTTPAATVPVLPGTTPAATATAISGLMGLYR
jgi:tellurite resistance protein TehA-like permease